MPEPSYGFSKKDSERIGRIVRRVERSPAGTVGRGRYPAPGDDMLIPAITTGSITTGTRSSPTTFTVHLCKPGTGAALADETASTTCYNILPLAATLTSPKTVWLTRYNGFYYLANGSCTG